MAPETLDQNLNFGAHDFFKEHASFSFVDCMIKCN